MKCEGEGGAQAPSQTHIKSKHIEMHAGLPSHSSNVQISPFKFMYKTKKKKRKNTSSNHQGLVW